MILSTNDSPEISQLCAGRAKNFIAKIATSRMCSGRKKGFAQRHGDTERNDGPESVTGSGSRWGEGRSRDFRWR